MTYKPWKVVHVALDLRVPELPLDSEIGGYFVVFWWRSVPLAHSKVKSEYLPMSATQLADLALDSIVPAVGDRLLPGSYGARIPGADPNTLPSLEALLAIRRPLRTCLEAAPSCAFSISVVICTRDRPDSLKRTLRSIQRLSVAPDEVVVVDNHPALPHTRELVAGMPGVRYVAEPRPGLSAARNSGIRNSTGDLLAFTDDDVIVHENWIARLREAFVDSTVMVVTGLVLPAELETQAQYSFELNNSFNQGYRVKVFGRNFIQESLSYGAPVWSIGAGANMAIRREAFKQVGLFDERLGAGASGCSEDSEIWYRVLAGGWTCRYDPSVVVHHYHRREMGFLRKQAYQYMRGHVVALLIQHERYGHRGNLYRTFVVLPYFYAKTFYRIIRRGANPERLLMLMEQARGCAAGLIYYLRHRTRIPYDQQKGWTGRTA